MRRRRSRALLTLMLISLGLLTLSDPASATGKRPDAAGATAEAPSGQGRGWVRAAHLAPVPATGDVYVVRVDGRVRVNDLPYGAVSDYLELGAGAYDLDLRNARAPAAAPSEHRLDLDVEPGSHQTVLFYGPHPEVGSLVMDDTIASPAPGAARVRAANVLGKATPVRVLDDRDRTILRAAPDTASDYAELPEGTHTLRLAGPDGDLLTGAVTLTLRAGETHALVATDGEHGQPELQSLLESAAAQAPTRIDTGAGGTAASPGGASRARVTGVVGLVGVVLILLAVAGRILARRSRCTIGTIRRLETPADRTPEQERA